MPARNTIKQFVGGAYYHLYNRGNNKQEIFLDEQDYAVFLSYLKTYLEPKDELALQRTLANPDIPWNEKDKALKLLRLNNFSGSIDLICYCLMTNHFHLLVHQKDDRDIDRFMNSLGTRYTMYCNKKYGRIGPLFQSLYKAVLVDNDAQLLHLSRYIHRNPVKLVPQGTSLQSYGYSSYPEYRGDRKTQWINTKSVLSYFSDTASGSYESFVLQKDDESQSIFGNSNLFEEE